jgi:hypothetical protein
MSLSSKVKKVKPKGIVELKVVPTVNRRGVFTVKTEQVKTSNRGSDKTPSSNHRISSSSPTKLRSTLVFDGEPIPCDLDVDDSYEKRKTLVFTFLLIN